MSETEQNDREAYRVYKNGSFSQETMLTPEKAEKLDGWQQWDDEENDFVTYRAEHVDDYDGPQLGDHYVSDSERKEGENV